MLIDRIQAELPRPLKSVGLATEHQREEWLDGFDWKAAAATDRNWVGKSAMLEAASFARSA